jgi:hypothetical protein
VTDHETWQITKAADGLVLAREHVQDEYWVTLSLAWKVDTIFRDGEYKAEGRWKVLARSTDAYLDYDIQNPLLRISAPRQMRLWRR